MPIYPCLDFNFIFRVILVKNFTCRFQFYCSSSAILLGGHSYKGSFILSLCEVSSLLICETFFSKYFHLTLLMAIPTTGTKLQVHYDLRCNRLVCEGVELLGLALSRPVSECKPMVWRELNMLPLNSKTLTVRSNVATICGIYYYQKILF